MLRNIDRCEGVIFTRDVALDAASGALRRGAGRIIAEAKEQGVLVALLVPHGEAHVVAGAPSWTLAASEPQTAELTALREALNVENPDGFGGSDGFGRAPGMAFGREPIAARCVVLVTTLQQTAAALGAGMRTVALPAVEGGWLDEELDGVADVCLDYMGEEEDVLALRVDDLSTPGAYWLNPAMPRDLDGMSVECGPSHSKTPSATRCTPLASASCRVLCTSRLTPRVGSPLRSPATGLGYEAASASDADEACEAPAGPAAADEEALLDMLRDVEPHQAPQPLPPPSPPPSPPPRSISRCAEIEMHLEIEPAEAAELLRSEGARLVDVRQPAEYRLDGHVDGSANVAAYSWEHGFYLPSEGFAAEVAAEFEKEAPLVLLCATGMLAKGAADVLEAAAFTNVLTLAGGLQAWEAEAEDEAAGIPALVIDEDGEGGLTGTWT